MKLRILGILSAVMMVTFSLVIISSYGQDYKSLYRGQHGWTLKQNILLQFPGQQPKLVGRKELYCHADGRRKSIQYKVNPDGTETRRSIIICDPGRGAFSQNIIEQKLYYLGDPLAIGTDGQGRFIDPYTLRADATYVRDERVLGYECAVSRNAHPNGSITESYQAYHLGDWAIKEIRYGKSQTEIVEPTSIEIGNVKNWEVDYPKEWPVDFSDIEDDIQAKSAEGQTEVVEALRRRLAAAKQRLTPAK